MKFSYALVLSVLFSVLAVHAKVEPPTQVVAAMKSLALAPAFPRVSKPLPAFKAAQRGTVHFLLNAAGGEPMQFIIKARAVGTAKPSPLPMRVVAPSGKVTELAPVVGEARCDVKTGENGVHCVIVEAGTHTVTLHAPTLAACAFSTNGAFHFAGNIGRLFFHVPAGTRKFGLTLAGGGKTEQVKAEVRDATGRVAAAGDNIGDARALPLKRDDASQAEIWTLEISKPTQGVLGDVYVTLNGLPALLAASPLAMLSPAGKDQPPPRYHAVPSLVLIGDSTVASYANPPADRPSLTGWGQVLDPFMVKGANVRDEAISGTSAKSFLTSGYWQDIVKNPGDYLLIQFGHNDSKKGDRYDAPGGTYDELLRGYIHTARGLGMKPILVTSVSRMIFGKDGKIKGSGLDPYVAAMKQVAEAEKVPLVDLYTRSKALLEKVGPKTAAGFQASKTDLTHFSRMGAMAMAELVAHDLKTAVPDLAPFLVVPAK